MSGSCMKLDTWTFQSLRVQERLIIYMMNVRAFPRFSIAFISKALNEKFLEIHGYMSINDSRTCVFQQMQKITSNHLFLFEQI